MVKISIVCLIYKSPEFADWVYDSVKKFTPKLQTGEAEFIFVANDPTQKVVDHLEKKWYTYFINSNPEYSQEELFKAGYAKPEYITKVYRWYNYWILKSRWERVVLINSDIYFSPDWLENLLKYSSRDNVVSSHLVERKHPVHGVFPWAVHGEFGKDIESFQEEKFLDFANKIRKTWLIEGKAYMPCMLFRNTAIQVGLYPEWNLAHKSYDEVIEYWDQNFMRRLKQIWVSHITALDSICYHLKEWEKEVWKASEIYSWKKSYIKKELTACDVQPNINKVDTTVVSWYNHSEILYRLLGWKESIKSKIRNIFNITKLQNLIYIFLLKTNMLWFVKKILNR